MGTRNGTLVFTIVVISSVFVLSNFSSVYANHVPTNIDDTENLWYAPEGFRDGYLEFINPTEDEVKDFIGTLVMSSPPQAIHTEEFTGYTLADGTDIIENMDNHVTHGDKADFDWVQENRPLELAGEGNHAPSQGALGWAFGSPDMSAHMDVTGQGAVQHGHSIKEINPADGTPLGTLPELENDACPEEFFEFVDVFSIISDGQDNDNSMRNSALDYVVDFGVSSNPLAFSPGIPVKVFTKGWTSPTTIDDYVARWMPAIPGKYDVVAIEPVPSALQDGHDMSIEIDAVKCYITLNEVAVGGEMIPIDATAVLIAGIQTNASNILGIFVVGTAAFGAMYYSAKRKRK